MRGSSFASGVVACETCELAGAEIYPDDGAAEMISLLCLC